MRATLSTAILIALTLGLDAAVAAEATVPAPYRLSIGNPAELRLASQSSPAAKGEKLPAPWANQPFAPEIDSAARDAALDPALVHALIYVESRYNPAARSPKGAVGLMQLMPETAQRYGVRDPAKSLEANLRAGTRYLSDLMSLFESRIELALAAYNAGENAVLRYGQRIPPYRETREYVPAVLAKYREWKELLPAVPEAPAATAPRRIEYLPGTLLEPGAQPRP